MTKLLYFVKKNINKIPVFVTNEVKNNFWDFSEYRRDSDSNHFARLLIRGYHQIKDRIQIFATEWTLLQAVKYYLVVSSPLDQLQYATHN